MNVAYSATAATPLTKAMAEGNRDGYLRRSVYTEPPNCYGCVLYVVLRCGSSRFLYDKGSNLDATNEGMFGIFFDSRFLPVSSCPTIFAVQVLDEEAGG